MTEIRKTKYILHVSDFHLTSETESFAAETLEFLSKMLDENDITIDYLIHTGDVIDASRAYCVAVDDLVREDGSLAWIADEYKTNVNFDVEKFKEDPRTTDVILNRLNEQVFTNTNLLYLDSAKIVKEFLANIRVRKRHAYFCVGNHDALRPIIKDEAQICDRFKQDDGDAKKYHNFLVKHESTYNIYGPYVAFLKEIGVWNYDLKNSADQTNDLNLVIINTNHPNPLKSKEGYYCIDCASVIKDINLFNMQENHKRLNIIIAHKPIYEICEAARMAFSSYHKTEFMTAVQSFLGGNGLYICGDKHTRSVSDTTFHSIQHVIGGAPLVAPKKGDEFHVEYNLIELTNGKVGNIQKIHLSYNKKDKRWDGKFRPEDSVVERLYELSRHSVIPQCLMVLSLDTRKNSWADISRIFYKEKKKDAAWSLLEKKLDKLYHIVCKYGNGFRNMISDNHILEDWDKGIGDSSIFERFRDYLIEKMANHQFIEQSNILNIRGEYSSGKSTFLGILYIYLLYQYSIGNINFIPAYFNLENKGILKQINCDTGDVLYYEAANNSFKKFVNEVQSIANTSHQTVCYLIDGLDEQDVWSYSSEDSVGRGILDVLSAAKNSKNIMSYSQHHLPLFKNTLPERKYKDYSDVMYFNNVHIVSADSEKGHFKQFVSAFYSLSQDLQSGDPNDENEIAKKNELICALIRKFCRLSISQNFLYKFGDYIAEKTKSPDFMETLSVDEVYRNYIDLLHKMCMDILGYGYVHYAPAMAYLFSFKGFTYERFKHIPQNTEDYWQKKIADNSERVYDAFIFIKKNQDVREYLIAMHYNRELRYYAENPDIPISDTSILNEFITRNIAILSRKMWKSDPNKFVIVCAELLEKRHDLGQKPICNCALSMLIYTLAHQAKMYAPSNKMLDKIISNYDTETGKISDTPVGGFSYKSQESDHLQMFLDYSLHRTYRLYKAVSEGNSEKLALDIKDDSKFSLYNRQYLRLYYGDLTISGENRKEALIPGKDVHLKGFDFHNTFNLLSEKMGNVDRKKYELMAFDLYSLCDLIQDRLTVAKSDSNKQDDGIFFRGKKNIKTQIGVLNAAIGFINAYLEGENIDVNPQYKEMINEFKSCFEKAIEERLQYKR